MIIDLILDRKDGNTYNAKQFYNDVVKYGDVGFGITAALDSGTEKDVKNALVKYLYDNDYNLEIGKYINSVEWLKDDAILYTRESMVNVTKQLQKQGAYIWLDVTTASDADLQTILKTMIVESSIQLLIENEVLHYAI